MMSAVELKWSSDGQLCWEYSFQKLLKSDSPLPSYNQKCQGCFFLRHSAI